MEDISRRRTYSIVPLDGATSYGDVAALVLPKASREQFVPGWSSS